MNNRRRLRAVAVDIQSRIGWRGLLALGCSGAVAGFTVPAIASSLIQQERRQPSVRLLRAPHLSTSETQIPQPESEIAPGARTTPSKTPQPLTLGQLEKRARRLSPIILTPHTITHQTSSTTLTSPAAATAPASKTPTPKATTGPVSPPPSGKAPTPTGPLPKTPVTANGNGGVSSSGTTTKE